ncbi:MAG: DNA mismatch repair protein MutS, partial [Candidatus Methylomirabilis sp.]|nr:DNA mismatch repair protein MutS [Deltaproteobacteria bacterium]
MPPRNLTPAMRQYLEVKAEHPGALVLFQMGDFYELFFEDAEIAARDVGITLTSRSKAGDPDRIPMAGFPLHAARQYLYKLVQLGHRCVVVDQVENPKDAKGVVRREVTRIVTPGTVLEEDELEARESNYLAALQMQLKGEGRRAAYVEIGLAYLDLSTGEFRATELEDLAAAKEEALRVRPAEVVVPETMKDSDPLRDLQTALGPCTVSYAPDFAFELEGATRLLTEQLGVASLEGFGFGDALLAVRAAGALLHYAAETQRRELSHVRSLQRYWRGDFMVIDDATRRNLEIEQTLIEGRKRGSLLGLLDRTVTPMGARLLRRWVRYPLQDLDEIRARQDAVEELVRTPSLRTPLREEAQGVRDLERLIARVSLQTANARDLVALRRSMEALPRLKAP